MIWEFSTNGEFKAYSFTSVYGFTVIGKWHAKADGQVVVSGTTYNTLTKVSNEWEDTFTQVEKWTEGDIPQVKLEHQNKVKVF